MGTQYLTIYCDRRIGYCAPKLLISEKIRELQLCSVIQQLGHGDRRHANVDETVAVHPLERPESTPGVELLMFCNASQEQYVDFPSLR